MHLALGRPRAKKTAPGPDGIPGKALAIILEYVDITPFYRGIVVVCASDPAVSYFGGEAFRCYFVGNSTPLLLSERAVCLSAFPSDKKKDKS